jgi:hypothetical protein
MVNTAPTRAVVEVLLMYPLQDGTPAERALYHIDTAAYYLDMAGHKVSSFWLYEEAGSARGIASAADTCAWNLESAEWHLSQIPAAYRQEPVR